MPIARTSAFAVIGALSLLSACGESDRDKMINRTETMIEPPPAAIPDSFVGIWEESLGRCFDKVVSASRLVVSPDKIEIAARSAQVSAVTPVPATSGDAIDVDATIDVDGMTQDNRYRLVMTSAGTLDITVNDETMARIRCTAR